MKWILASERLPDNDGEYFCRWSDRHDLKIIGRYRKKWEEFDINEGQFKIEWLDESDNSDAELLAKERAEGFDDWKINEGWHVETDNLIGIGYYQNEEHSEFITFKDLYSRFLTHLSNSKK